MKTKAHVRAANQRYYAKHGDTCRASSRKYYVMNKEARNAYNKAYGHKYRRTTKGRYRKLVQAHRRLGGSIKQLIPFEYYEAMISGNCFYCDGLLGSVQSEVGVGLDRINNARGYDADNVLPCCGFCNYKRSDDLSVFEAAALIRLLIQLRRKSGDLKYPRG